MKRLLIVLAALLAHTLAGEEAVPDPFAPRDEEPAKRPQRMAPSQADLKRFGEPVLRGEAPEGSGDIRFIWVPTFDKPISIRASRDGEGITLKIVRLSGKGGYEWGTIETQKTVPLPLEQWNGLQALASVDGAREPSQKAVKEIRKSFRDFMSGLDGEIWYLEVRDKNGYTVEGVPNPILRDHRERGDPFAEDKVDSMSTVYGDNSEVKRFKESFNLDFRPFLAVCLKMLELSGLDERSNE